MRPNAHDPSWPPVLVFCVRGGRARRPVRRGRVPAAQRGTPPPARGTARWLTTVHGSLGALDRVRPGRWPATRSAPAWQHVERLGTIGPRSRRARAFRRFGDGSAICFPVAALYGEEYIELGEGCIIGPYCSLSAGVMPGQVLDHSPVVTIGDRVPHRQGERDRRPPLDRDRRRRVHRPPRVHHRRQPRLRGRHAARSASSSRRPARCASAAARGSATAPWCCPAPTSAATSWSARARWSPARCPTSASPSATRRG